MTSPDEILSVAHVTSAGQPWLKQCHVHSVLMWEWTERSLLCSEVKYPLGIYFSQMVKCQFTTSDKQERNASLHLLVKA